MWRDVPVQLLNTDYRPGLIAELVEATLLVIGSSWLMAEALSTSSCAMLNAPKPPWRSRIGGARAVLEQAGGAHPQQDSDSALVSIDARHAILRCGAFDPLACARQTLESVVRW